MAQETTPEYVDQLERKVSVLTQLAEVSSVLNSTLQLDTLLKYIMDKAAEITAAESASVLLWNHNTRELFFAATTSGEAAAHLIGKPVPLDSIAGTILREKRIIQVDDVSRDPRHYGEATKDIKFVTRSLLGVPMTSKEKIIGVLEAVNKREMPWSEDDQHYLSILAAQAAVAIDSAQLLSALRKANDDLNQVDKLKSDFIAIASHELRTPLGVIMGYASFLQDETSEEVSEHAAKVMASALQLRRIIEDMINLRYLKQSTSELQREAIPVNQLLEDARRDILALTDAEGHKLDVQFAPDGTLVYIDQGRVMMALTNLLNNAVRFTPKGGRITITAEVRNREAWISVTDTGIGMESDKLEKIFEEFYQVEDHMVRHYGGLGIGLSIARALILAHGGRIWATSSGLGKGSTFTMTLPLARATKS